MGGFPLLEGNPLTVVVEEAALFEGHVLRACLIDTLNRRIDVDMSATAADAADTATPPVVRRGEARLRLVVHDAGGHAGVPLRVQVWTGPSAAAAAAGRAEAVDEAPPAASGISKAVLRVVSSLLRVTEQPSHEFYKDTGGRTQRLELTVRCEGRPQQPPRPFEFAAPPGVANVALQAELRYESGLEVPDQAILARFVRDAKNDLVAAPGDGVFETDDRGEATVLFRINQVSKNHQGQRFRLLIKPAVRRDGRIPVGCAFSEPITVFSKDKNKRKQQGGAAAAAAAASAPATVASFPSAFDGDSGGGSNLGGASIGTGGSGGRMGYGGGWNGHMAANDDLLPLAALEHGVTSNMAVLLAAAEKAPPLVGTVAAARPAAAAAVPARAGVPPLSLPPMPADWGVLFSRMFSVLQAVEWVPHGEAFDLPGVRYVVLRCPVCQVCTVRDAAAASGGGAGGHSNGAFGDPGVFANSGSGDSDGTNWPLRHRPSCDLGAVVAECRRHSSDDGPGGPGFAVAPPNGAAEPEGGPPSKRRRDGEPTGSRGVVDGTDGWPAENAGTASAASAAPAAAEKRPVLPPPPPEPSSHLHRRRQQRQQHQEGGENQSLLPTRFISGMVVGADSGGDGAGGDGEGSGSGCVDDDGSNGANGGDGAAFPLTRRQTTGEFTAGLFANSFSSDDLNNDNDNDGSVAFNSDVYAASLRMAPTDFAAPG